MDAGLVIRLSSGFLFAALGIFVVAVARRHWKAVVYGLHLALAGGFVIAFNLLEGETFLLYALGSLPFALTGFLAAYVLPTRATRREWPLIGAAIVLASVGFLANFADGTPTVLAFGGHTGAAALAVFLLTLLVWVGAYGGFLLASLRLAFAPRVDRERALVAAALALPTGLWHVPGMTTVADPDPFTPLSLGITLLLVGVVSACWLAAAHRGGGRFSVAIAWSFPATALAAYIVLATVGLGASTGNDRIGLTGILRIAAFAVAALAVVKTELLGVALPRFARRRGTLAAVALAMLFIVAEVMQNVFSATYGLVTGGIVAGAFLFAAAPVQRTIERILDPRATPRGAVPHAPSEIPVDAADAYRHALRAAMREGGLSRREERHLALLARALGIDAAQALELREEIENEARDARA